MTNHSIHQPNLDIIASKANLKNDFERSPVRQTLFSSGDKVYLYGDTTYTGILIHPVERTSPPRWTVKADRGGYEAVNVQHITVTESIGDRNKPDLEIPFSDTLETSKFRPVLKTQTKTTEELEQKIKALENTVKQLEDEQKASRQQVRELEQENEILRKDLESAKQIIRRAKDASPVMRLSLKRVMRLAHHACMDVRRIAGGWILKMGDKARKFKRLWNIWDLISQDEFILSEIFPEDKLVDLNLVRPPKKRKIQHQKITVPLMRYGQIERGDSICSSCLRESIINRRNRSLVPSG